MMPTAELFVGSAAAVASAYAAAGGGLYSPMLGANLLLAGAGFIATSRMTLAMRASFVKARLCGIDLNKPGTKRDASGALVVPIEGPVIPEAMGLIAGCVYLTVMFIFIPFAFMREQVASQWGGAPVLSKYLSALLAICCMCFLGFADNVLDLRWRDKLWLPLTASLPLLMVYAVDGGSTTVLLPPLLAQLLAPWVGITSVNIGLAYYAFMASLAIFCTNAINILAGVNGIVVGQSVVIAVTIAVNNCIQLHRWPSPTSALHQNNLFSLSLILPFIGCSLALLVHNWHPAKVFVGDTYCYFAGMTFAVSAILGHNAKTMLLFFLPQIVNFVYSCPQLFKLIPCPRHRMPGYDQPTDRLILSWCEFEPKALGLGGKLIYATIRCLGLARIEALDEGKVRMSNLTLINYALMVLGPMHEARLTSALLILQGASSVLALLVRYQLAGYFYEVLK